MLTISVRPDSSTALIRPGAPSASINRGLRSRPSSSRVRARAARRSSTRSPRPPPGGTARRDRPTRRHPAARRSAPAARRHRRSRQTSSRRRSSPASKSRGPPANAAIEKSITAPGAPTPLSAVRRNIIVKVATTAPATSAAPPDCSLAMRRECVWDRPPLEPTRRRPLRERLCAVRRRRVRSSQRRTLGWRHASRTPAQG